jgi:hypothetical protein
MGKMWPTIAIILALFGCIIALASGASDSPEGTVAEVKMQEDIQDRDIGQSVGEHFDLRTLGLLPWNAQNMAERYQENCGNCWVWAGTACLEVSRAEHMKRKDPKSVPERLSVQWLNSHLHRGETIWSCWACCGGTPKLFSQFYSGNKKIAGELIIVPWANQFAKFKDGVACCGTPYCPYGSESCSRPVTQVPAGLISSKPGYRISSIKAGIIETGDCSKEEAIMRIKKVLKNGHKAIFLGVFLADDQWDSFRAWWRDSVEESIWSNMAIPPGTPRDKISGHAVNCIGYNDIDPNNRYWVVLNSWGQGAPGGCNRPNGVFHLTMDLDYSTNCFFWTIDPEWADE